jgi:2-dehydropantoate 2-reductase
MNAKKSTITVIGAGAIGGVTAAYLSKAGHDVKIVCKHQDTADLAASRGLHLFGVRGESYVPVKSVREIGDLSGTKDLVLLAVKANDCVAAARELLPFLGPQSTVVSLQNGICEDALGDVLGRERVIGCVVGWGATMHGPAELEITSPGEFVIGNIDGKPDERLPLLRELLAGVVPTRISDNIMGELYSKLVINSCINSLGVITGETLGELLAREKVRRIFLEIMREAIAVADAMGIKVEPGGGGKLDYYKFLGEGGAIADFKRHLTIRIIGFKYRRIRSSSLQSIERGRLTEIDYLNGYICQRGREHAVPTPVNETVVSFIKAIESGNRPITPENLDAREFAACHV